MQKCIWLGKAPETNFRPLPDSPWLLHQLEDDAIAYDQLKRTGLQKTLQSDQRKNQRTASATTKTNAVTLSNATSVTSDTNDDTSGDQPIIFDNEGYDEAQLREGMKHESKHMKLHDVYNKVDASTLNDVVIRGKQPPQDVRRKKEQAYEVESARPPRRLRTKTLSTLLHRCLQRNGYFSRYRCHEQAG